MNLPEKDFRDVIISFSFENVYGFCFVAGRKLPGFRGAVCHLLPGAFSGYTATILHTLRPVYQCFAALRPRKMETYCNQNKY